MFNYYNLNNTKVIILLGKTGNGKSALGNLLLNKNYFDTSSSPTSKTVETKIGYCNHSFFRRFGVIDTPGLNDSENRDQKHYENIMNFIKDKYITSSVLVFNFNETKISSDVQELIKIYCNIFNYDFFNHLGLVFTRTFLKSKNKLKELKSIKEEEYRTRIKDIIENFFNKKLNNDLPCFFVDNDLEDIDEDTEEERDKIIQWILNSSKIDLDNIEIKEDLRIKYEYRDTKTDYSTSYSGNYKYTTDYYYYRYNKVDINNNTHYGDWISDGSSTSSYKYKSSCIII